MFICDGGVVTCMEGERYGAISRLVDNPSIVVEGDGVITGVIGSDRVTIMDFLNETINILDMLHHAPITKSKRVHISPYGRTCVRVSHDTREACRFQVERGSIFTTTNVLVSIIGMITVYYSNHLSKHFLTLYVSMGMVSVLASIALICIILYSVVTLKLPSKQQLPPAAIVQVFAIVLREHVYTIVARYIDYVFIVVLFVLVATLCTTHYYAPIVYASDYYGIIMMVINICLKVIGVGMAVFPIPSPTYAAGIGVTLLIYSVYLDISYVKTSKDVSPLQKMLDELPNDRILCINYTIPSKKN